MADQNSVELIGRIVGTPQIKNTKNGGTRASFRMMTIYETATGKKIKEFHNIVAWGDAWHRTAERVEPLNDGSRVEVQGRLHSSSYEREDGQKVYKTEVVAETIKPVRNGY